MNNLLIEQLKTLTILYVEDEERIRKNIAASLQYYVKEVFEAENGQVALDIYHSHKPDIVITDILMPLVDGLALARSIRKKDFLTPLIIVSAHTDKEYLLKAVDLHLEQYLIKPITLQDIIGALIRCINRINENKNVNYDLSNGYYYDASCKQLLHNHQIIILNKKEALFIELLIQHKQRIVTYDELQEHIWQNDIMTDSAVRSLVRNLRKKLPYDFIKNFSGIGYRIEME